MATYDRRLESQDQPGQPRIDHGHPYYGPDRFAMEQPLRDQPRAPGKGIWERIRGLFRRPAA